MRPIVCLLSFTLLASVSLAQDGDSTYKLGDESMRHEGVPLGEVTEVVESVGASSLAGWSFACTGETSMREKRANNTNKRFIESCKRKTQICRYYIRFLDFRL